MKKATLIICFVSASALGQPINGECYFIRTFNNLFVQTHGNGFGLGVEKQRTGFTVIKDGGNYYLQSADGNYVSADGSGAIRRQPHRQDWEVFSFEEKGPGKYFIRSSQWKKYLRANLTTHTLDQTEGAQEWELFEFVPAGASCRIAFLHNTKVVREGTRSRFQVNVQRGLDGELNMPLIHTYHIVSAPVPVAVLFPAAFRSNLPGEILRQIANHGVDNVDIFFAPQLERRDTDASLKPAYWMFPNRPKRVAGGPPDFNKTALMGIFDTDQAIANEVTVGELRPFAATLHDGLVSPDTGHLNMGGAKATSFAFYSLVIFEEQKRAAVTLHWMLTDRDRGNLVRLLDSNSGKSLEDLLKAMNSSAWFKDTGMMQKLNRLTS